MSPVPGALTALVDTLLPERAGSALGPRYPSGSSAGVDQQIDELVRTLPKGAQEEFGTLLRSVESRGINFLLSGRPTRFSALDPPGRERYLLAWSRSRIGAKRRGFQAVKRLAVGLYFSGPVSGPGNPLWSRIGYSAPAIADPGPDPLVGFQPSVPPAGGAGSYDVVVIGSGAGGAVIAAEAARAGYRTAVLEAGAWWPPWTFPRIERDAFRSLFFERGVATTQDRAIALLAGESLGGSTTINWMTCLRPRMEARTEWVQEGGILDAAGPEFDRRLETIETRMHVTGTESALNGTNRALRAGCIRLGYTEGTDWSIIRRNAVDCRSRCGFCTFGCPYSARQSAATTFLADALQAGAQVFPATKADLILVEGGRARGVRATCREAGAERSVEFRAKAVVVAAGALQTPGLLLRSGIQHPGVGLGLRLDPTTALAAELAEPVRTWEGPHQTIGVYRFQTTDPGAHGPWIEAAPAHPGLAAIALPWRGAEAFRSELERLERVATLIALVRDVGEGRVRIDREGRPLFEYRLTQRDRANLLRGLEETARICAAAGATRLLSLHTPPVEVGGKGVPVSEPELADFLAGIRRAGIRENAVALFSAHPMGSARAGTDPRRAAARPTGEVHGVDGLWIGDGSLLPSAPGVNPMITIAAMALRTSEHLIRSLGTPT